MITDDSDWSRLTPAQREWVSRVMPGDDPAICLLSHRASVVLQLTYPDGERYLAKVSAEGTAQDIEREHQALVHLGGAYAARVHDFASGDGMAALVLRWVDGASLLTRWTDQVTSASGRRDDLLAMGDELTRLHARALVHGDLQPTHVRFVDDQPTLIDFGVAGAAGDRYGGGLIHFLAPEYAGALLAGDQPELTAEADWYALLASAFVGATQAAPVRYPADARREQRLSAIADRQIFPEEWSDPLARDLAAALLQPAADRAAWFRA